MPTFNVTATELKNRTAEIIDKVVFANEVAQITKHGTVVAEIRAKKADTEKLSINDLVGIAPDFLDVKKYRTKNTHRYN